MPTAPPSSRRRGAPGAAPGAPLPPPLSLAHPAMLAAATVTVLCLIVSVSFRIDDPDLWQHLAVGRAIWTTHALPHTNVWTWPTYGEPYLVPSWGFRALLWPVWEAAGERGLAAWRWITTLGAFALLWAAARRLGARGFSAFLVLALCGLVYRGRTEMRPETLVAILFALELWILEARRRRGRDWSAGLVAIAAAWVNVHISWPIGLVVLAAYALDDLLEPGPTPRAARFGLLGVGLGCAAAAFLNPFGGRAVWQPFDFLLHQRGEPIYRGIAELQPVQWAYNLRNGLPLLVVGWPLLALARAARRGVDWAELALMAFLLAIGLSSQRFIGFLALGAAPFVARDLEHVIAGARPAAGWRTPARLAAPWTRAALVAAACVGGSIPEWTHARTGFGTRLDTSQMPVAACDFMARHEVRGQGLNPFHFGGYLLWRFWPDPGRLPFMDIHQTGTALDRTLATGALINRTAYRELMARYPFDYALVDRQTPAQVPLLDFLDQDSTFALVFVDDAAALFVRRAGPGLALADSFAYRAWPAGYSSLGEIYVRYPADSGYRAAVDRELELQIAASPANALAHDARANLALLEGRTDQAERELRAALAASPRVPRAHERLGLIALRQGRARDALREFALERRDEPGTTSLEMPEAEAWSLLGERGRAAACYRRELERDPENLAARDSLERLERGR